MRKEFKEYNSQFFKLMRKEAKPVTSHSSAEEIVPYILELLPLTKSVIDVGGVLEPGRQYLRNAV